MTALGVARVLVVRADFQPGEQIQSLRGGKIDDPRPVRSVEVTLKGSPGDLASPKACALALREARMAGMKQGKARSAGVVREGRRGQAALRFIVE